MPPMRLPTSLIRLGSLAAVAASGRIGHNASDKASDRDRPEEGHRVEGHHAPAQPLFDDGLEDRVGGGEVHHEAGARDREHDARQPE